MYTFYAYWNGDQVTAVLNAIALIMNGGDYLGLLKAVSIVGILVAAGSALVRMRGEEPLGYFIMFALFYGTLFVPKATVTVQDLRTANVYTVANVPLGVAFFATETSHIGKWLTETFETNFTSIDDVKFEKNGMAFGARLIEQLQAVKVRTPSLQQDLIAFVKDCINPELLDNPVALNDMVKSTDLWGFIGGSGSFALNPGRSTIVGGVAMTCGAPGIPGAYQQLTTALNAEATARSKDLAAKVNPGNPLAQSLIASQIPAVEGLMLNVARTAQESITQGMVMNMMRDSQTTVAQLQGNPQAAQVALAVAMAEQSSAVSYAAMAKVAEGALPKLRNAIELLVIGVFPVLFILVVLAGMKAGLVLKSYLMAMFWVQLWAPLYAIINFMATKTDTADLLGILNGTAGNTMENMGQLADTALSNQSIAGLLTISVPMIALALVKGGEVAMSGVASSIMSPAQGAAQRAGDSVGQGNVNAGNVSWGNTSANNWQSGNWGSGNTSFNNAGGNKQDLSSSWADPQTSQTSTPWGSYTQDGNGNVTGMQSSPWNVGGTVGGGTTLNRADMNNSGDMTRATTGRSATLDISSAATSSNRSSAEFARQLTSALATGVGTNGNWGQSWNAGTSGSASTETSGQSVLQNQDSFRWNSRLGFGADVGTSQAYGPYGNGLPGGGGGMPGSGGPGGQGPGNGIHAAQAAPGGSGNTLPVPAGEVLPAGSKAGPVMGRRGASISAGSGADSSAAQVLIDTATNKSGSVDQNTKAHAAQVVMAAVKSVMANTNDLGVRAAGQTFAADFQNAVRAGEQQSAGVQHERSAGNTQQQGTQNQVGGSMSMGAPVAQQLLAMAGGDPMKALQLSSNPQTLAQATRAAAAEMKANEGNAFLGAGGARGPDTQADVAAQGNADVNKLSGQAKGAAGRADAANRRVVAGHQPASPTSSPNTTPATTGFSSTSGGNYAAYNALSGDTAFAKGATDVAAAMYKDNQQGVGTVLANTFAFGAGYKSPQEYQQALTAAAASSPKLASTLKQIGSGGGKVSPQAMEYIQSELKSFQDSQPGFFSKMFEGVTGR